MRALEIMGLHEISEAIGVRPNTILTWVRRGHMPGPDARLACGPVWRTSTVTTWINGPGRERIARVAGVI